MCWRWRLVVVFMCCNLPSLLMGVKCLVMSFHHTTVSSSVCGLLSGRWLVRRRGWSVMPAAGSPTLRTKAFSAPYPSLMLTYRTMQALLVWFIRALHLTLVSCGVHAHTHAHTHTHTHTHTYTYAHTHTHTHVETIRGSEISCLIFSCEANQRRRIHWSTYCWDPSAMYQPTWGSNTV